MAALTWGVIVGKGGPLDLEFRQVELLMRGNSNQCYKFNSTPLGKSGRPRSDVIRSQKY